MSKKTVLAQAHFREVLRELEATEFDAVVRHLKNRHGVNFPRSPGRKDVAKALAKHEDGASLLTGAIKEINQAGEVLEKMAREDADRALKKLDDLESELED